VNVFALKSVYNGGARVLTPVVSAKTNDLGEYHLFWLPPGRYYLAASVSDLNLSGLSTGSVLINPDGAPDNEVTMQAIPRANVPRRVAVREENERSIPIYYPATANPALASVIEVSAGAEIRNADIRMMPAQTFHVRGRITASANFFAQLAGMQESASSRRVLLLRPLAPNFKRLGAGLPVAQTFGAAPDAEAFHIDAVTGQFDIPGVVPGEYIIAGTGSLVTHSVVIDVRGDVEINLKEVDPIALAGRVLVEGETTPFDRTINFEVWMFATSGRTYGPVRVQTNGSFQVPRVAPGHFHVFINPLLSPMTSTGESAQAIPAALKNRYVKSIRLGDKDVLSEGLRIDTQTDMPLVITLGKNLGAVEGQVVDDGKTPVPGSIVALIPESGMLRFHVDHRFAYADAKGRFQIEDVPPWRYRILALDDAEPGAWQDPDFVNEFLNRAVSVEVSEGARERVEILSIRK
jgi:hypothetical protein